MRKLLITLGCALLGMLLGACARPITSGQAAALLRANREFALESPRQREVVSIKRIVEYAPDTPYDYDVDFTWRWHGDSRILDSWAHFQNQNGCWTLTDFDDENHHLVQIGFHPQRPQPAPFAPYGLHIRIKQPKSH